VFPKDFGLEVPSKRGTGEAAMPGTIVALTYNSGAIPLTLAPEDVEEFNMLPRLPREIPDDFEPPSVIVTDIVTGRTYWMARSLCGLACDCRAYVEDITDSREAFTTKKKPPAADRRSMTSSEGPVMHLRRGRLQQLHWPRSERRGVDRRQKHALNEGMMCRCGVIARRSYQLLRVYHERLRVVQRRVDTSRKGANARAEAWTTTACNGGSGRQAEYGAAVTSGRRNEPRT